MRPIPMITCKSVPASSDWYQRVLGLVSAHGGDEYEMLTAGADVVLQLHESDVHEHNHLLDGNDGSRGNGVALWFEASEFDAAAARIRAAGATVTILEDVHVNPLANHLEVWLQDPDGYKVVISSPYGEVGGGDDDSDGFEDEGR